MPPYRRDHGAAAEANIPAIVEAAVSELARPTERCLAIARSILRPMRGPSGLSLIERIFLDRDSQLADTEALGTVKSDAANRVFNISCRSLAWAIIDSGIAASHPSFAEYTTDEDRKVRLTGESRVRATYDLTLIDRICNFDLTLSDEIERAIVIEDIVHALKDLPGTRPDTFDAKTALF